MFKQKPTVVKDVERGQLTALSVPAKQDAARIAAQHTGPATPVTPGSPAQAQAPLLQVDWNAEQGKPDEAPPFDQSTWGVPMTDVLSIAFSIAHAFFTFYVTLAFLITISGEPSWIEPLKSSVVWVGIAAGVCACRGIHNALAKNVYYSLLQHKVIIDFANQRPWHWPLHALNDTFLGKIPGEFTRFTSFLLIFMALGSFLVGLGLFITKWGMYADARHATGYQRWTGGGPWSFLAGALGAFLSAGGLLTAYRAIERFYLTLLPFNVLMASSQASDDHNQATQIKAWVGKCVVVREADFLRLAMKINADADQREKAYRTECERQGRPYLGYIFPAACAAVKYKSMAATLHADPTAAIVIAPPLPTELWPKIKGYFSAETAYSTLCANDFDNLDPKDQPSTFDSWLCIFTCGLFGKRRQSTINIAFIVLFFFLAVAIVAGILNTQATGTTTT